MINFFSKSNSTVEINHHPQRIVIEGYVERIDWALFIFVANTIIFFGFIGGFAFFSILFGYGSSDSFWGFGAMMCVGIMTLLISIYNLKHKPSSKSSNFILDELNSTVSFNGLKLSFSMIHFFYCERDYRHLRDKKFSSKFKSKILISHRSNGPNKTANSQGVFFDAWVNCNQIGELQAAYLRNFKAKQQFLIEQKKEEYEDNMQDELLVFGSKRNKKYSGAEKIALTLLRGLSSKLVTTVGNLWSWFLALFISLFNLLILWRLLT